MSKHNLWHKRTRVAHNEILKNMISGAVETAKFNVINNKCEICLKSKFARLACNMKGNRATQLLQFVHADLCGPMEMKSIGV